MTVGQYLLKNVYILSAKLGMLILRQLSKTLSKKIQTLIKDNLLLKRYIQVRHLNLQPAAFIAAKLLQKENLETAKLSKLCLRIGNLTRRF